MRNAKVVVMCAALAVMFLAVGQAQAGNVIWDNSAGTTAWATATNWSTDALPGVGDVAYVQGAFTQAQSPVITVDAGTIDRLQIGSGGGTTT